MRTLRNGAGLAHRLAALSTHFPSPHGEPVSAGNNATATALGELMLEVAEPLKGFTGYREGWPKP
ncbi:hypothetical protein [Streptomyces sp. NPDC096311]|uniref:hypothetical protein n=1 Tax=Streptomyces sp. NPDC096311 TaxID=3366083 RepID=UPI0038067073